MKAPSLLLLLWLIATPAAVAQSPAGKPARPVKDDKPVKPTKPEKEQKPVKPVKPAKPEKPLTAANLTGVWTRGMGKGQQAVRWYGLHNMSLTIWDTSTRTVIYHGCGYWDTQDLQSQDSLTYNLSRKPEGTISFQQTVSFSGPNSCSLLDAVKGGTPESWGRITFRFPDPAPGQKPAPAADLAGIWERKLPGSRKAIKWYGFGRVSMTVYDQISFSVLQHYEGTWQVEGNRSTESLQCATKPHLKMLEKPLVHRVVFQDENRCRLNNVEGGPQEEWTRIRPTNP